MTNEDKKKFKLPTKADKDSEISVEDSPDANHPFKEEDNLAGDSVDEHKEQEAANEAIARKEISQTYNNA